MALDIYTITLMAIVVLGSVGFLLFYILRTSSMYTLEIIKDYRNPSRKPYTLKAVFKPKKDLIAVYKSTLSLFRIENVPYFNQNAFASSKRIRCVVGASGQKDDGVIIPINITLMSRAAAADFGVSLSNEVAAALEAIPTDKKLDPEELKNIFGPDWIMKHFGIVDIQNANVFCERHKTAISSAKALQKQYENQNLSWLAQNPMFLMFGMVVIMLCIGAVPYLQASSQAAATLNGQSSQQSSLVSGLIHYLNNNTLTGATAVKTPVTATTTIVTVSNGTQVAP